LNDDGIQVRRIFADVLEPRMPFWRDLAGIEVMGFVINPSVSEHRFGRVLEVFVPVSVFVIAERGKKDR
jgi:hypothetical protein